MRRKPFSVKAILFDFDDTLTKPHTLDYSQMNKAVGCPPGMSALEFIASLPVPDQRDEALETLRCFELKAAENSIPNHGAEALISFFRSNNIRLGIISRNNLQSIERTLGNFRNTGVSCFDVIISRDTPVRPKPDPEGVLLAAQKLKVDVHEMLMVGDHFYDIQAGKAAGAITVFLEGRTISGNLRDESDFTITCLDELIKIVRLGSPLPAGKFPNDLLAEYLHEFSFDDPSVLVNPGIGEDTAAVDVAREEVLVLKSDPITFTTDSIGHHAVLINANDIATSGARPRWFLATLLFPIGTTPSMVWQVMYDLRDVCRDRGITLCGGHTEITDAVSRPVVTGMMAGTMARHELIDKRMMNTGDRLLMTKAIAVEGTSIIARELGEKLSALQVPDSEIAQCRDFLLNISILEEADIASRVPGVSAMHDVTEGGLATALEELSIAGVHKIKVEMDQIPVFPQTRKLCNLLGIDPLGLIGSGSLLICCREASCDRIISEISNAGIAICCIGEVAEHGQGVVAYSKGMPVPWPHFEVDEIARLFQVESFRQFLR